MTKQVSGVDDQSTVTTVDSSSKLEAIKNLIFGDNIQQYDSEFEALKQDIKQKQETLQTYIDQAREELMTSVDSLSTDINIRITELESTLEDKIEILDTQKIDKALLGDLLISLGEKIQK